MIYSLGEKKLITSNDDFWVAPTAVVIGSVVLKTNASVWFGATLRGDNDPITIGENSNIQDGCVCHTDDSMPLNVGDNVTVGHMVILHSCSVGNNSLIGMGSIIMNGATIGKGAVVGAGAIVTENMHVPDLGLVVGLPGKVIKTLSDDTYDKNVKWAKKYVQLATVHKSQND